MTEATRKALIRIDQILHEAEWDQVHPSQEPSARPVDLAKLRHAYESLLRQDHFDIVRAMLGKPMTIEQFAEKMTGNEDRRQFGEILRRLRDFVDSCGGVESALVSEETSRTVGERR